MKDQGMRWATGACVYSEVQSDGWLGVQVGLFGDEKAGAPPFVSLHPYGFTSWPMDPDDADACQALIGYEGDQGYALPLGDGRVQPKLPPKKSGGSAQYGSDGSFCLLDPETNTWTVYQPVDFDSQGTPTKAHLFQIGKDTNGKRCITLLHADGPALSILEGGKRSVVIKNAASDAFVEVNDDGIVLNGKVSIKGGLKALEGTGVTPLARAAELTAWAALVQTALTQLAAYVNGLAPGSVVVPAPLAPSVASTTLAG